MKRLTTVAAVNDRINALSDELRTLRAGLPLDSQGIFIASRERAIRKMETTQAEIDRLYTLKRTMLNDQAWHRSSPQETILPVREVAEMLILWKRNQTAKSATSRANHLAMLKGRTATPSPFFAAE